jgi:hypothetical protein
MGKVKFLSATLLLVFLLSFSMPIHSNATESSFAGTSLIDLKGCVDTNNLNIQEIDSQQQILLSNYNQTLQQYNEYVSIGNLQEAAILKNQLDQENFDISQYSQKQSQQKLTQEYQFQVNYYNVCLSMQQLQLNQSQLNLVNEQIIVEEEKLKQGTSTQLNVDQLSLNKQKILDQISTLNNTISLDQDVLKTELNQPLNIQFSPSFIIPDTVDNSNTYTLLTLTQACENDNLNLLEDNAFIGFYGTLATSLSACVDQSDPSYCNAVAEKSNTQIQADILRQQIDISAEQQYDEFSECLAAYNTSNQEKNVLNEKKLVLNAQYTSGSISELDYLTDNFSILQQLNAELSDTVNLINARTCIVLVQNGILPQSSNSSGS